MERMVELGNVRTSLPLVGDKVEVLCPDDNLVPSTQAVASFFLTVSLSFFFCSHSYLFSFPKYYFAIVEARLLPGSGSSPSGRPTDEDQLRVAFCGLSRASPAPLATCSLPFPAIAAGRPCSWTRVNGSVVECMRREWRER